MNADHSPGEQIADDATLAEVTRKQAQIAAWIWEAKDALLAGGV